MNKLFTKIAALCLGATMAVGVGVAVANNSKVAEPVHAADSLAYTITLKDSGSSSDGTDAKTALADIVSSGNSYVSSVTASYVYQGKSGCGVKLGSGNYAGVLTLNLSSTGQVKATKVVFELAAANDTGKTIKLSLNGATSGTGYTTYTTGSTSGSFADKELAWDGSTTLTSIKVDTTAKKFRTYLKSIKVYTAGSGSTYTVTYNNNGGSGTITDSNSPYSSGATVTVKDSTGFTAPSGKEFDNWNTAANGTGTSYAPGETFTISANTTLYAQWADESASTGNVTIAYSGSTTNMTGGNDAATLGVSATDWSVVGYKGGNANYPGLNQNNRIHLYYNATKSNYICVNTLVANRTFEKIVLSTGNSDNFAVYAGDQTTSGTAISGSGGTYRFGNNVTGFTIYNTNTTNVQVYIYSIKVYYIDPPATYTVTYNGNNNTSGSVPTDATAYSDGDTVTVKTNSGSLARTGYTFGGWNTSADGTGTNYAAGSGTFAIHDDTTLFAKWNINSYTVSFDVQGHGTAPSNQTIQYGGKVTKPADPSATGYTFGGWYKEAACTNAWNFTSDTIGAADKVLYALWTINTYTISLVNDSHGSLSGTTSVNYNTALSITLVADAGYGLPASLDGVTMGGNDISANVTYDDSTGAITGPQVTGNVVIDAHCVLLATEYSITVNIDHDGTYSGDSTITDMGGTASVSVTAGTGYKLPDSISVTGASFTYTKTSKYQASIALNTAIDDVVIAVECVQIASYNINFSGVSNATYSGDTSINEDGTATITFIPNSGYYQPDTTGVTVTGATKASWVQATGVLTISNPTGAVSITYVPVQNELSSITLSSDSGNYILGDSFNMPVVTAHYSQTADVVVTASATYSGFDPYTVDDQTVTISYIENNVEKTASYTAHVTAKVLPTTITWTKVTDASDLSASDEIVIVAAESNYALSTTQNENNRPGTAVTKDGDTVSWTGESVQTLTLETGTVSNTFGFNTGDGYLYAASSSKNYLRTKATLDADGSFSISITSGVATIQAQGTSTHNLLKFNSNDSLFSCYASGQAGVSVYKKHTETSGQPTLIKVTAEYVGGTKSVGSTLSTEDFEVEALYDTAETETLTSFTISPSTLASTSNDITISYGGKSDVVNVTATSATVTSVQLVETGAVKKSGYIDWSGATWDLTNLTVRCTWSNSNVENFALSDLVEAEHATLTHSKPTVGDTSFTVSYSYNGVAITDGTVTLTEAVVADSVSSISWTNVSADDFKAYSGTQLTAETAANWVVVPTWAGRGEASALSFGEYTLKIGDKAVNSLPYTWQSEDDGAVIKVVYGGKEKGNSNAHANICASINAIDHEESSSGDHEITLDLTDSSYESAADYKGGTSGGTGGEVHITIGGFVITTDGGYVDSGKHVRVYKDQTLTISTSYTLKNVSFTFTGSSYEGLVGGEASGNSYSETTSAQSRLTAITISFNGTVTETVHYANQMDHFDAQKAVVTFAKFMNTTMNGTNVCSGTFANLGSAWDDVADKYDELFGSGTSLNETELAWAKKMFEYATAQWGDETEPACVERAMKTYEFCVANHGLDPFMDGVRSAGRTTNIVPVAISNNVNATTIIIVVSVISVTAIGGYFFLRKRREEN